MKLKNVLAILVACGAAKAFAYSFHFRTSNGTYYQVSTGAQVSFLLSHTFDQYAIKPNGNVQAPYYTGDYDAQLNYWLTSTQGTPEWLTVYRGPSPQPPPNYLWTYVAFGDFSHFIDLQTALATENNFIYANPFFLSSANAWIHFRTLTDVYDNGCRSGMDNPEAVRVAAYWWPGHYVLIAPHRAWSFHSGYAYSWQGDPNIHQQGWYEYSGDPTIIFFHNAADGDGWCESEFESADLPGLNLGGGSTTPTTPDPGLPSPPSSPPPEKFPNSSDSPSEKAY